MSPLDGFPLYYEEITFRFKLKQKKVPKACLKGLLCIYLLPLVIKQLE